MAPSSPRPDLYVVGRILEALLREQGPMRKTRLQMAAGVNYSVFQRYCEILEKRGLLRLVPDPEGGELVELTVRGQEALHFLIEGMARVLEGFHGADRLQ